MRVDVICLTKTTNQEYLQLCLNALETLCKSEPDIGFDVVLVESENEIRQEYIELVDLYPNNKLTIINPRQDFNYNRFLNIALSETKGNDWLIVMNNDVVYEKGWLTNIIDINRRRPDLRAFSPFEPDFHKRYYWDFEEEFQEGYTMNFHVSGWCMVMRKSVMDALGKWDERFEFWFQDEDYALFLRRHGIGSAIARKSIVRHLGATSHSMIPNGKEDFWTKGMQNVLHEKWDKIRFPLEEPKIKMVHLLLNPDFRADIPKDDWDSRMQKQKRSIDCWRSLSHRFTHYVESYSLLNRSELPEKTCADPAIISKSYDLENRPPMLSYGHYGAYLAHKRAIMEEFSDDIDGLLIVEGDAMFTVEPDTMMKKIQEAVRFSRDNEGHIVTFAKLAYGLASQASISDTSVDLGDWLKVDHFLHGHCYLIMKSEKERIQEKLTNTGWHVWDIWFYWNYDRRANIFATKETMVFETDGHSMIDYKSKSINDQGGL